MNSAAVLLSTLAFTIWISLIFFWGRFWRCDQTIDRESPLPLVADEPIKSVCAVIPARNEAEVLPQTLRSLLQQKYPGSFKIVLVDDHSTDGTATIAREIARSLKVDVILPQDSLEPPTPLGENPTQLHILTAKPLPAAWTGKLWALEQGTRYALNFNPPPDYFLLTDADIDRDSNNLQTLAAKAQQEDLDLVSLMVLLRTQSIWEKLLIPAFVFFFQKLYPFPWVNDPDKTTAAAAGGCILIKREALVGIGGIECIKDALIDDCALAMAVKCGRWGDGETFLRHGDTGNGRNASEVSSEDASRPRRRGEMENSEFTSSSRSRKIWLGLTHHAWSLRPYDSLGSIWDMVARTAFTQLNYSPLLLFGTLLGMILVYLVAPLSAVWGSITGNWEVAIAGWLTWFLMTIAYLPTIRFYRCSVLFAPCLPMIALFYTLMTLDSALRHWQGRGGTWKGRSYSRYSRRQEAEGRGQKGKA